MRPITARKARVWVAQGRLSEALEWARAQGLTVEDELSYLHEFEHITLARLLLACHRMDNADGSIRGVPGLLERLQRAAEERGGMGSLIEILVLQALVYHAQGDLPAALLPLQKALALAEPEGYVRIFLDEGEPMRALISDFRFWIEKQARIDGAKLLGYSDKLLAAFAEPVSSPGKSEDESGSSLAIPEEHRDGETLSEPLSQREFKILQLIAQGRSNREIGERLFLALDTIKGHNRKLFDKLQVQSRTEAVARSARTGFVVSLKFPHHFPSKKNNTHNQH